MIVCPQKTSKFKTIVTPIKCKNISDGQPPINGGDDINFNPCDDVMYHVIHHTLTSDDIASGYLILPVLAHPLYLNDCMLFIDNGPVLLPPHEYEIVDQPVTGEFRRLQWRGYGLNGMLEPGEFLRFKYVRL